MINSALFDELSKIAEAPVADDDFITKDRLKRLALSTGALALGVGLGRATGGLINKALMKSNIPMSPTFKKYAPPVAGVLGGLGGLLTAGSLANSKHYIKHGVHKGDSDE